MAQPNPVPTKADRDKAAVAQRRASDELRARAATEPLVATIITTAHARLKLWQLCAKANCDRERGCAGDALACAARHWPVACSCMEAAAAARGRGQPPARGADEALKVWLDHDGLLTKVRLAVVGWLPDEDAPAGMAGAGNADPSSQPSAPSS
jgi:hypothetical protein